jgi:hypothetical protein
MDPFNKILSTDPTRAAFFVWLLVGSVFMAKPGPMTQLRAFYAGARGTFTPAVRGPSSSIG